MLAIRCQFLQGTYQASPPGQLTESEWPPHPCRLHAALVAAGWAWGGGAFPSQAAEALAWLESLPAPLILTPAGAGAIRRSPTTYVPRNFTSRETTALVGHLRAGRHANFQRGSGRVPRTFPTRVVGDEPVWFVWPKAEPSSAQKLALERLAGELQYLGSSRSPVLGMALAGEGDEQPWAAEHGGPMMSFEPTRTGDGGRNLRVAYPGLTTALLSSRGAELRAPLGASATYRQQPEAAAASSAIRQDGPFASLAIKRRRRADFGLTVSHVVTLTEAFRAACLSVAGDEAPAVLHGHGDHPHAAYLALPNVGGVHSDGVVLGLGVAIPATASETDRKAIRAAVAGVRHLNIGKGALKWTLKDIEPASAPRTLQAQRWIGPAKRWSTVTPVILDRHPKPAHGFSLDDALHLSFENAMLPQPVDGRFEASRTPSLGGSVAAVSHLRTPRLHGLALHITVTFPVEVVGPVLVGKGRHLGLGLFAPVPERYAEAANRSATDPGA